MNKMILSQIFNISLEINGFGNESTIGNQTSIKEVLETFNAIIKVLKPNGIQSVNDENGVQVRPY